MIDSLIGITKYQETTYFFNGIVNIINSLFTNVVIGIFFFPVIQRLEVFISMMMMNF